MLLDCAQAEALGFRPAARPICSRHRFDYVDWIELKREDRATIGVLEPEWNDFDRLTPDTKILHTTKRRTQPWKTGLPVDYTLARERPARLPPPARQARRYEPHPDRNQEAFVYSLLADMVDEGAITRHELVARNGRQPYPPRQPRADRALSRLAI